MRISSSTGGLRRRRSHGLLALGAAFTLIVTGCGGDDSESSTTTGETENTDSNETGGSEVTDGGSESETRELIIARDMDINSLDPSRAYCDTCQIYLTAVYETLITVDPTDLTNRLPRLASNWEANDDNTVFTFMLNPSATFADGSPVEAKDVKWTWERLHNVKGSAGYLMDGIASIETPDDKTVVATFGAPNSAFLPIVSAPYMGIMNSDEAVAQAGSVSDENAETADTSEEFYLGTSLGSGPYILESYTEGDALVLAANANYWNGAPAFPGVTIKQVKDSSSQLQQLQAGDVDIAMQISIDSLGQLEGDPNLAVSTIDSYNYVYVAFSPGSTLTGGEQLQDPNVRLAMKLALDYEGIIDATVAGNGKLQASPIPNGFEGSAGLALPAEDLDQAAQLMADAGLADGFALDAVYPKVNVYGVDFDIMMQKVQQDLKRINIDLQLQPVEFSQWRETINATGIPVTAVYFAPDHTDTSQYPGYFGMMEGSPWSARAGGGAAGAPIINPDQAPLLAEALAASGDAKAAAYAALGQSMIDDLIFMPLVNPQLVLAAQADVKGMHYSGCCNLDLSLLSIGS
ncbi:MAG: ABC transporter substrate-binding protein [Actinomycetota bacterium]|jgi:peptide/nickel transport system substrate-binding protein|nr:ABC transporter substrate-binding protein [Actinomycetota bacterium]